MLVLIASTACWCCSAQQTYADRCGPHTTGPVLPSISKGAIENVCHAQASPTISQLKAL